jgi:hypothetical protein
MKTDKTSYLIPIIDHAAEEPRTHMEVKIRKPHRGYSTIWICIHPVRIEGNCTSSSPCSGHVLENVMPPMVRESPKKMAEKLLAEMNDSQSDTWVAIRELCREQGLRVADKSTLDVLCEGGDPSIVSPVWVS